MEGDEVVPGTNEPGKPSRARAPRRLASLAIPAVAAALGLAACGGGSSTPHVASLKSGTTLGITGGDGAGSSETTQPKGNATALADEWAACERDHGDPNQADPTIDAYGVVNIIIPNGALPAGDPHDVTGECSRYLAAAQSTLRSADPVPPPPDQAALLRYVQCMRANGVPNYPYPQGNTTDFIGTGVDPNSPVVMRVNDLCGKKIGAPAWWTAGTGPPGDITVGSGSLPGNPPACAFTKAGCGSSGPGSAVPAGGRGGSGSGG